MAYSPKFDNFSLQDDNYITSEVVFRTIPKRSLGTEKIARRPGVKLLAHDFAERIVNISGYIIGSSLSDLREKIDNLHANVTRKEDGLLSIDADRSGTATVASVSIADPHYAQDFVPFEMEFLMADPFWYGSQHSVSWTIASGISSLSDTITVSGSVFAEPSITYYAPSGDGQTTTSGIIVEYAPTGEKTTWSGTGATSTLAYGDSVTFDYGNHIILEGTDSVDVEGVFSRWEPGATNFTVTFSGTAQGGSLEFVYQPRYL